MDSLLNALINIRGTRLLNGTSSSPTSTSPRQHLNNSQAAQFVPHSFNLPQQISPATANSRPNKNRFLPASTNTVGDFLELKSKSPEEPKNTGFRSPEKLERTDSSSFSPTSFQTSLLVSTKEQLKRSSAAPISFQTAAENDGKSEN
ncbi:hypothetical protein F511_28431 [Dorcoceras hygrometricum]|uniref:Uncharacterized protein n=1 Tax=Dorcoceras hygrometricum TaxID=472368 RepID=A0A2Z7DD81_9LAMI|nr:hypothetical protein F511_28431 [Dorcoceras hygrometricum]